MRTSAAEARAILAERRSVLDDVNTIAAYAQEMRDFLVESELTERRAFITPCPCPTIVSYRDGPPKRWP